MAVVENATMFGVEVAVETTFTGLSEQFFFFFWIEFISRWHSPGYNYMCVLCVLSSNKPARLPSQQQRRSVVALNLQADVCWRLLNIVWKGPQDFSISGVHALPLSYNIGEDSPRKIFAQHNGDLLRRPPCPLRGGRHHSLRKWSMVRGSKTSSQKLRRCVILLDEKVWAEFTPQPLAMLYV